MERRTHNITHPSRQDSEAQPSLLIFSDFNSRHLGFFSDADKFIAGETTFINLFVLCTYAMSTTLPWFAFYIRANLQVKLHAKLVINKL